MKLEPHPWARLIFFLLAVSAVFTMKSLWLLGSSWGVGVLSLAGFGLAYKHLRICSMSLLPLLVMLLAVWGWFLAAPPNHPLGSDPHGGVMYAVGIVARLGALAAVFQLSILTIPTEALPNSLHSWGIRGDSLVIALGAFTLVPELQVRADQVLSARLARGLVARPGVYGRITQIPFLLQPLLTWTLRSATQRSDSWNQSGLIERIEELSRKRFASSTAANLLWIASGVVLLCASLFDRWPR